MRKMIKNVVVISLGFLGDTLLVEPMCRNIKQNFPDVNLIFIVNKAFKDIPMGFDSVDKVYVYDKKEKHKGILGCLTFLKDFKEKNIDYTIITHPHERSLFLAKIIKSKNIISLPIKKSFFNFLINKKRKFVEKEIKNTYKANFNNKYLEPLCEYFDFNAVYNRVDIDYEKIMSRFNLPEEYIVLSPCSKDLIRDWDYKNVKDFISNCGKTVVLVGTEKAKIIAQKLIEENIDFIDLTLKTTIVELGVVLKKAQVSVSVDTGTLHLSYAQGIKTIGIFFNKDKILPWTPQNLDNLKIILGERQGTKKNFVSIKDVLAEEVIREI